MKNKLNVKITKYVSAFILIFAVVLCLKGVPAKAAMTDEDDLSSGDQAISQDIDYIYGRPLTDEEAAYQESLVPKNLSLMPTDDAVDAYAPPFSLLGIGEDSLLAQYDSREKGLITSVKDQNPYNNCWAFATLSAFEASLIKQDIADNSIDLSEAHLCYYVANTGYDALDNTIDDYITPYDDWIDYGGNFIMSVAALSNWKGVTTEDKYPLDINYNNLKNMYSQMSANPYEDDEYYLKDVYAVPSKSISDVKKLVSEYGAVYTELSFYLSYYNSDTAAYYCNKNIGNNHAVTIVGWDDDYSAANFRTAPPSNGAFIAKNSWGSEWGDQGYFYISYNDLPFGNGNSVAFVGTNKDESLNNYYHCGGVDTHYSYLDGAAESFVACSNVQGKEAIESVGIFLSSSSVPYKVKVYVDSEGNPIDINTDDPVFTESGITSYAGYYIHEFENVIEVLPGERFTVAFFFDNLTKVYIDGPEASGVPCYTYNTVKENEGYYAVNRSYLGYYRFFDDIYCNYSARINVFTRDLGSVNAKVTSANLATKGSLALKMYVEMPRNLVGSGAYAVIDGNADNKVLIDNSVVLRNIDSKTVECVFETKRAAKELNDPMKLQLFDKRNRNIVFTNNEEPVYEYSIMDYLDSVISGSVSAEEGLVNLCKVIKNYGYAAQEYFNHDVDKIGVYTIEDITDGELDKYERLKAGNIPSGLEYKGSSLILDNNLSIRHYFEVNGNHSINEYNFELYDFGKYDSGNSGDNSPKLSNLTPVVNDGWYYVETSNISPVDFDRAFTIVVNKDYKLKYCVNSYVKSALNNTSSEKLKKVVCALYSYGLGAKEYYQ